MFTWIQGIFIIFIETLCCKLFFEAFSVRRKEIKEEIRGIGSCFVLRIPYIKR